MWPGTGFQGSGVGWALGSEGEGGQGEEGGDVCVHGLVPMVLPGAVWACGMVQTAGHMSRSGVGYESIFVALHPGSGLRGVCGCDLCDGIV